MASINGIFAELRGVSDMKQKMANFQKRFPDRAAAAAFQEAQPIMTQSKKLCPVDTTADAPHPGLLRSTGRVLPPARLGKLIIVTMTYGTDYAIFVHENLENHHPIGQARFLAVPIEEARSTFASKVAARMNINNMGAL